MEYAFRSHKDPEFGWVDWLRRRIEAMRHVKPDRFRWVTFR
jgi:hypothetical protein